MFYSLNCFDPDNGYIPRVEYRDDDPFRFWINGEKFETPPELPIRLDIISDEKTVLPEMWLTPIPVMSLRLYNIIASEGVQKIEIFPVEVREKHTGQLVTTSYVAFNLLDIVSALDLRRSTVISRENLSKIKGDIDINKMVIDSERAKGFDLFRLEEMPTAIIVSERIKNKIEQAGIQTLTFSKPEDLVF